LRRLPASPHMSWKAGWLDLTNTWELLQFIRLPKINYLFFDDKRIALDIYCHIESLFLKLLSQRVFINFSEHQEFNMADSKIIIAFDLYGTLLSTESIAKQLATHFGDSKADIIATLWRRYQLEYTWRLNSMSLYSPLIFRP
jgi:hypothetical protein